MARKKIEFRPDPTGHNCADKLRLTPLQQKALLKWVLYSLVCLVGLVLQDSMLARLRLFGGCFDVTPALIVLICVGGAMILYELGVFAMGLFQGLTYRSRWPVFVMTAIVGTLTAGTVYALLKHIGTIGGNAWKE